MPAWAVALLVAFVGLATGLFTTYARNAHERLADLRARMLDAADDFVTTFTLAHEAIESAALPTGLWVEMEAYRDAPEHMREERQRKVETSRETASAKREASRQRVPRVALLFGVESPTARAAKRADDALGTALVGLAQAYSESWDPDGEPMDGDRVTREANERLEVAASALREFSTAAHQAIAGPRLSSTLRLTALRRNEPPCPDIVAAAGELRDAA
jgi:hypothetical protein